MLSVFAPTGATPSAWLHTFSSLCFTYIFLFTLFASNALHTGDTLINISLALAGWLVFKKLLVARCSAAGAASCECAMVGFNVSSAFVCFALIGSFSSLYKVLLAHARPHTAKHTFRRLYINPTWAPVRIRLTPSFTCLLTSVLLLENTRFDFVAPLRLCLRYFLFSTFQLLWLICLYTFCFCSGGCGSKIAVGYDLLHTHRQAGSAPYWHSVLCWSVALPVALRLFGSDVW